MIKVSLTSSDVNRQIEALKALPKIATKHYRPALSKITKQLKDVILPMIPKGTTGRARKDFGSKVVGATITSLKGQVGWYDKNDVWYPNILEYGAKPHLMAGSTRSKKKQRAFESKMASGGAFAGTHVFIKGGWKTIRMHPGFSGIGFMAAGYSALKPIIDHELQLANEAVVKELAT